MLMHSPLARDRRQPPGYIRPCKPVLSLKVPIGPQWIHELKHDGFRIVAHKDGDEVRLWSRNGRNWSAEMVANTAAVMALPVKRSALDGEAVAHCPEGLPDFNASLGRSGLADGACGLRM
jgi:bifunctional non-homologous end joining protein LigD